ncbi:MAG TPA: sigma 54-interacting transcriptional regulator [Polyangium sp.]|nr:sigma 54-interacting transcriptional regulator [Polyangium sp.]
MTKPSIAHRGRYELVVYGWNGEPQRHRLPVVGQVGIGRDPRANDICIQDPSVSGRHAVLTVDAALKIQDLGSTNGTILRKGEKDVEITRTERKQDGGPTEMIFDVEPGDRIRFGSVVAMVRLIHAAANANSENGETWPYPPVVRHPSMLKVYDEARMVAQSPSRACVLLRGETGVGKDVMARAIHSWSKRAKGPFVAVNCPSIAETMFAKQMFGHKKGAYTDARTDEPGLFEVADGGTLFLDEIGDLALSSQITLLRVLDDRQISRVGDTQSKLVNVRVIAATNQALEERVTLGLFRKDLFHRLQGFELEIPPLRSRPADIVPMAEAFLEEECRAIDQGFVPRLSAEVVAILQGYDFPGNVRELRNAMEHVVAFCQGKEILPAHLPKSMREADKTDPMVEPPFVVQEPVVDDGSEEARIRAALQQYGGNATRAAEALGRSKRWIFNKLAEMDVPRPRRGAVAARAKN